MEFKNGNTTLRSLPYHKVKGIKTKKARQFITSEELEAFSRQNLENLRAWVKLLPAK